MYENKKYKKVDIKRDRYNRNFQREVSKDQNQQQCMFYNKMKDLIQASKVSYYQSVWVRVGPLVQISVLILITILGIVFIIVFASVPILLVVL